MIRLATRAAPPYDIVADTRSAKSYFALWRARRVGAGANMIAAGEIRDAHGCGGPRLEDTADTVGRPRLPAPALGGAGRRGAVRGRRARREHDLRRRRAVRVRGPGLRGGPRLRRVRGRNRSPGDAGRARARRVGR